MKEYRAFNGMGMSSYQNIAGMNAKRDNRASALKGE